MITAEDILFWLDVTAPATFADTVQRAAAAVNDHDPSRWSLARAWVRAASISEDVGDRSGTRAFRFLAALLLWSIRMDRLAKCQRVETERGPVWVEHEDLYRFLDWRADEIRSLDVAEQAAIIIAAERQCPTTPDPRPPPRSYGKDVWHSRNPVGTRQYARARGRG